MELDNSERKATREGYGAGMMDIASDERVVALCADLTGSVKLKDFKKEYPDRFFQAGVAEQNMVGMAAGLALTGKIPFISTFGAFIPNRTLDQVRINACYQDLNMKFCITHTGLTVGEDGATHQAMEDIAAMRSLPNMTVVVPCDYEEAKKAVSAVYDKKGPVYLRLGRSKIPVITKKDDVFEIGKANILREGKDVTIVACGVMVYEALLAAQELSERGIDAEVINNHTIKPIDEETLVKSAEKTGCVMTAEEHQKYGGLGSAVAEVLVQKSPVPMEFVAVNDTFGESGKSDELMEKYHITSKDIILAAKRALERK